MANYSSFFQRLLLTLLIPITIVTATPRLLPRHPYNKSNTGTAPYPTGTGSHPTYTSYPTYHPTGSVSSTFKSSTLPSTTQTTPSQTSSTTPPTGTPTSFKISINVVSGYPTPPPIHGYAVLAPGGPNGAEVFSYTDDISLADTFTLNADGTLQSGPLLSSMPPNTVYQNLLFQTPAAISSGGFGITHCTITEGGVLACSTRTGTLGSMVNDVAYTCQPQAPYTPDFGPTGRPYNVGCYNLVLGVVGL